MGVEDVTKRGGGWWWGVAARRRSQWPCPSPSVRSSPPARPAKGLRRRDPGELQPLSRLAARTARASRSPPAAAAAALAPASLLPSLPPASRPMGGHRAAAVAGRIRGSRPPPPCPALALPSAAARGVAGGVAVVRRAPPSRWRAAGNKTTCSGTCWVAAFC